MTKDYRINAIHFYSFMLKNEIFKKLKVPSSKNSITLKNLKKSFKKLGIEFSKGIQEESKILVKNELILDNVGLFDYEKAFDVAFHENILFFNLALLKENEKKEDFDDFYSYYKENQSEN